MREQVSWGFFSRVPLVLGIALAVLGCDEAEPEDGDDGAACEGAKCDNSQEDGASRGLSAHRSGVAACLEDMDEALARATSQAAMANAVIEATGCIEGHNDDAAAFLDRKALSQRAPASGLLQAYRDATGGKDDRGAMCQILFRAHNPSNAGNATLASIACDRTFEQALADVIDAGVDFGNEPGRYSDRSEAFAKCHEAFEQAVGNKSDSEAYADLTECMVDDALSLAGRIGNAVRARQDPMPQDKIMGTIQAAVDAGRDVCQAIGDAGQNRGGSLQALDDHSCRQELVFRLHGQIKGGIAWLDGE